MKKGRKNFFLFLFQIKFFLNFLFLLFFCISFCISFILLKRWVETGVPGGKPPESVIEVSNQCLTRFGDPLPSKPN